MITILVAEDEKNVQKLLVRLLEKEKYQVLVADDGQQALDLWEHQRLHLLVLDVMMPKLSGIEVAKKVRQTDGELPILLVTAKDTVLDKKIGFGARVDDYMVKPINEEEFILRVGALLRRAKYITERHLVINQTSLELDQLKVIRGHEQIYLPKKEFLLLFTLLASPNQIFTRQQLMNDIWARDSESDERTVDGHIKKIRKKFEANPDFSIETIRGLGYKGVKHET